MIEPHGMMLSAKDRVCCLLLYGFIVLLFIGAGRGPEECRGAHIGYCGSLLSTSPYSKQRCDQCYRRGRYPYFHYCVYFSRTSAFVRPQVGIGNVLVGVAQNRKVKIYNTAKTANKLGSHKRNWLSDGERGETNRDRASRSHVLATFLLGSVAMSRWRPPQIEVAHNIALTRWRSRAYMADDYLRASVDTHATNMLKLQHC